MSQSFKSRKVNEIIQGLRVVLNMYKQRGFIIQTIHGDNEFDVEVIIEAMRPTIMRICGHDKHIGVAERSIRTIKK